jgi:hypothetical protein
MDREVRPLETPLHAPLALTHGKSRSDARSCLAPIDSRKRGFYLLIVMDTEAGESPARSRHCNRLPVQPRVRPAMAWLQSNRARIPKEN